MGAYGAGFERGSMLFVKGARPGDPYKPFFESLEYGGSFVGDPPSIQETLIGRFGLGEHPQFSWLTGITVPLWLVLLIVSAAPILLVLARRSHAVPDEAGE